MEFTKFARGITLSVTFSVMGALTPVLAATEIFTASIDRQGNVLSQSPKWISEVDFTAHPNYFSDYKIRFVPGVFKKDPRFCSVSPVDVSSTERIYYGHAKLGSVPKKESVNVLALSVGDNKPSGDSSLDFMLMCAR